MLGTLKDAGIRVLRCPYRTPNANAYAERFVRSIKSECLDRMIFFGVDSLHRAIAEYVEHYHREVPSRAVDLPACPQTLESDLHRRLHRDRAVAKVSAPWPHLGVVIGEVPRSDCRLECCDDREIMRSQEANLLGRGREDEAALDV
jgi:hypothetical protein